MTPRVTLLLAVSLVVYVSLSLYHWRQEKKMPGTENRNAVHSVLARDGQEKNWIQVSTSPGLSGQSTINSVPAEPPVTGAQQTAEQKAAPQAEILQSTEDKNAGAGLQERQTVHDENKEPPKPLQEEKKITELPTDKVEKPQAQKSSGLQGKNTLPEGLKDKPAVLTAKPDTTIPSRDNQVKTLQSSLASRLDALAKANDRITALAERLEQSNRTLAETKDTNNHLQRELSETETARIKARQEADRLVDELIQAKEDKEKYLAETGRLHKLLQEKRTRLARIENELNKSHLKAEAMLRYGQEQTDLVTPFIQQIKILNAQREDQKSELIEAEDQISQLRSQEKVLQDKIKTFELDVEKKEAISQELLEKSQSLAKAKQHSDELTLQLKVLADQINAKDVMINKLNQDLTLAQTNAQDAAARHAKILNEETGRQQDELASARQALTDMKQQLDEVTARQNETETKLNEAKTENKQLAVKFAEQETAARAESESISALLTQKDKQLEEANGALLSAQTTIQELKAAQETMAVTNTAETDETIRKLRESLANAERRQTDETETAIQQQQKIDLLNKTIADHDTQQKSMEQKLSIIKEENKQLQERINAAEQENRNAMELATTLEQKTTELNEEKARVGILESKVSDLQSDLDRRENTFFAMQEEYTSLQNKHDSLLKERDALLLYTLDSDNDTISDAIDTCPGTVSGAEVGQNGCELDQDGDTIVDRLDLCPDTPEKSDINPLGCSEGAPIVLSGIYFSGGDTDLSPSSRSYLDKVAAVLDLFGDLRFEVAGHTDNIGETGRNLNVSKKRAEAVSNYLVESGVEAWRLVSVGYGPDQPVADNRTSEGRAANRRVELRIISQNTSSAVVEERKSTVTAEEEGLPGQ